MKHSKFLTIAVASVMAVSAFALASCEKKPGDTPSGDGMLKDTSIQEKIIAAYTFENGGAATNPYTGEALSQYDVTMSDSTTVDGYSGKGFVSGDVSLVLPKYGDAVSEASGFSFTFMSYSEEALSDWNVLLSSDFSVITYGNLSNPTAYPSIASELGRGAYSAEMFAAAKEAGLSTEKLVKFNDYTGYNAGVVEGATDTPASISLYNEMVGTWQVMTVVVTEDSIRWYRNGALAYVYGSDIVKTSADYLLLDIIDLDEGSDAPVVLFSGAGGTIDNLIVGNALTAKEVIALYNDLTGSSLTEEEAILQDADASALNAAQNLARSNALTGPRAEVIKAAYDAEAGSADPVALTLDENGKASVTFTQYVTPTKGVVADVWNGAVIDVADGTGAFGIVRPDWFIWSNAEAPVAYTVTTTGDVSTLAYDLQGATVTAEIEVTEDGNIIITYTTVPVDAGASYTGTATASLTTGKQEVTETVDVAEQIVVQYTITNLDVATATFSLRGDGARLVFGE